MTSIDVNFRADKEREYELFLIWRSMPRDIKKELFIKLGVTDEIILKLSNIPNQKELAKYLKVSEKTITDWNKRPIPEEYQELDWRYWAKKTTPSVVSAVLRNIRKHGDASRATWWMTHVEGYEPNSKHEINGNLFDGLADLIKRADEVLEEHDQSNN